MHKIFSLVNPQPSNANSSEHSMWKAEKPCSMLFNNSCMLIILYKENMFWDSFLNYFLGKEIDDSFY